NPTESATDEGLRQRSHALLLQGRELNAGTGVCTMRRLGIFGDHQHLAGTETYLVRSDDQDLSRARLWSGNFFGGVLADAFVRRRSRCCRRRFVVDPIWVHLLSSALPHR